MSVKAKAKPDRRRVHLPETDCFSPNWNKTLCGRKITDRVRMSPDGDPNVDGLCGTCLNVYDFGGLTG